MQLQVTHRIEDNICLISLQSTITWRNSESLYFYTDTLLKEKSPSAFIINLEKTPNMNSSGVGILLTIHSRMKRLEIPFILCGLSQEIQEMLQSTHLDRTFSIYQTEKEALLAFLEPSQQKPLSA